MFLIAAYDTAKEELSKVKQNAVGTKVLNYGAGFSAIDSHYEKNHRNYMSDDLILKLVVDFDGRREFLIRKQIDTPISRR